MKKEMKVLSGLALSLVMAVFIMYPNSVHAITCQEAVTALMPCLDFLKSSNTTQPVPACCSGVQKVNSEASTPEIRKTLCECFKSASKAIRVNPDKAKQLPGLCHVKVSIPMDPKIDCGSIHF